MNTYYRISSKFHIFKKGMNNNKFALAAPIDHVPTVRTSKLIVHLNGKEIEGEELFNDKRFLPPMLNPKVYESHSNILFIPTIKLTNEMFPSDMSEEDKRKIFLIESRFEQFFQAVRKTGKFQVFSSFDSVNHDLVESNISFLLKMFFIKNESFYYNANAYKIIRYDWNDKYYVTRTQQEGRVHMIKEDGRMESKKTTVKKSSRDNYNVIVDLHLKKGAYSKVSVLDNVKLTCNQRKEEIWNKWDTLMKIGYENQLKKVNDQIKTQQDQIPLKEDVEETDKHYKAMKDLKQKRISLNKEKKSYINNQQKIQQQNRKRKSPKPKMLSSRTYYTTARTIDAMNNSNEKNEKKKDSDLPVAIPVLEPVPEKKQKGGKKTTTKRYSGNTFHGAKTMKRRVK